MTYVASSAIGPGTDITYSLDGKTFGTADQLTVQENGAEPQGARRRIQTHPLGVQKFARRPAPRPPRASARC